MLLHASITGLQGVCRPNCVKLPSVTAASRTMNTAMGLRFQLFSPSPAKKGNNSNTAIPMTGAVKSNGVSAAGGRNDSTA